TGPPRLIRRWAPLRWPAASPTAISPRSWPTSRPGPPAPPRGRARHTACNPAPPAGPGSAPPVRPPARAVTTRERGGGLGRRRRPEHRERALERRAGAGDRIDPPVADALPARRRPRCRPDRAGATLGPGRTAAGASR